MRMSPSRTSYSKDHTAIRDGIHHSDSNTSTESTTASFPMDRQIVKYREIPSSIAHLYLLRMHTALGGRASRPPTRRTVVSKIVGLIEHTWGKEKKVRHTSGTESIP